MGARVVLAILLAVFVSGCAGAYIPSTYASYNGANNLPRRQPHAGVDFVSGYGAPALAAADGRVLVTTNRPGGCGHSVFISHDQFARYTVYCHLKEVLVKPGDAVKRGETIGLVGTTGNAVNISDGLDGLAGGLLAISFTAFGVIALLQGQFYLAGFCFTVVGALLSYLWFNIYPARFFMGDVGSFAFGVALGVVAMFTNTLFLLPIIGIIFVIEAGSSLLQITSKRLFHRKIFTSAPIHHHLEAAGWPETKVTMRFWVIGAVAALIGVYLAIAGGHI
ncbi:MAG: Phospho-N-acetylmuramoyl-pentapeptide-transferase [Parcubacteria group bacterium GW2011_GWC1_41_7]|nr:MAG: Phospho-N-acetylmuramoyl-pentapeptide-transferase [Parcubacteria group bacterium GW2011_GWC1_41_7]